MFVRVFVSLLSCVSCAWSCMLYVAVAGVACVCLAACLYVVLLVLLFVFAFFGICFVGGSCGVAFEFFPPFATYQPTPC